MSSYIIFHIEKKIYTHSWLHKSIDHVKSCPRFMLHQKYTDRTSWLQPIPATIIYHNLFDGHPQSWLN